MNVSTMKLLDNGLGLVLCLLVGGIKKILDVLPREKPKFSLPNKILILKFMGMGSISMGTPAVAAIREKHPDATVDLLTFAPNAELARALGCFDQVLSLPISHFLDFAEALTEMLPRLRAARYDVVLDFEFFSYFSHLVSYFSGARRRIGFISPLKWRGVLATDRIFFNHYRHMTQNFLTQAYVLGCPGDPSRLARPSVDSEARQKFLSILRGRGVPENSPLIAINPNASDICLERRWPAEYFADLVCRLGEKHPGCWFAFLGSAQESGHVARIIRQLRPGAAERTVDLSGILSIGELLALLERSALLITNDSGPMHMASLLDTPTVSFFGPTHPSLLQPQGAKHRSLYKGIWCSPCLNFYILSGPICAGDNICMKQISVEEALDSVEEHAAGLGVALSPLR